MISAARVTVSQMFELSFIYPAYVTGSPLEKTNFIPKLVSLDSKHSFNIFQAIGSKNLYSSKHKNGLEEVCPQWFDSFSSRHATLKSRYPGITAIKVVCAGHFCLSGLLNRGQYDPLRIKLLNQFSW